MIDSGASVNCVDEALVARAGGTIKLPVPGRLLYPDHREAEVLGTTEVLLKARGHTEKVEFWVIRGLGIEALLGDPWLRA